MDIIGRKLSEIGKKWFYSEPLLFSVFCTHTIVENPLLNVPLRSGAKRIEYSPKIMKQMQDVELENYLTFEIYRILLGHPYERKPYAAKNAIMLVASDVTIYALLSSQKNNFIDELHLSSIEYLKNQAVRFHTLEHPLGLKWSGSEEEKFFQRNLLVNHKNGRLEICDNLTYEQWYKWILFLVQESSSAGENAGFSNETAKLMQESAELWEENEEIQKEIRSNIEKAEIDEGWGGLSGNLQRAVKESCDFSFDYRRALLHFRQNIVSSHRKLTRMKPSRRYGFSAMGSRYESKADILIAVDVSGSISDESFDHFSHCIKNFFFLGIVQKIDVIFFDVNIKNTKPQEFRKKIDIDNIKGRGGTNFQPVIDFFCEQKARYSGLIIFTDGEGSVPVIPDGVKNILWILDSRLAWEKSKLWINTLNKNFSTYLPF